MALSTTDLAAGTPAKSLSGVKVLIEGPTGTGKTYSLATLSDCGLEVFVLFTESGLETLRGYWADKGQDIPPNVHWHVLERAPGSFALMAKTAETINTIAQEALHKMQDPNRGRHNQFTELLKALVDFPDDRTGKKFGAVDTWGPDRVLAIDSLSGLNPIVMSLVVGGKPVRSQPDWGIAMDQIEKFIWLCTNGCRFHFVLTAHVEREVDQVFGGTKITVSTLGVRLAPKLPPMFSDVILTQRLGTKFSWSTVAPQADLKARNLPWSDDIPQDFKQIINKWQSRGGVI